MIQTLEAPCQFEETIRNSRFLAQAAPVSSQADTLAFYESVADPSATHNCWAWRVSLSGRSNDDGEPSGTAGRPILGVIEGRDLDGVMVVVTRWYGGIKLGAGGLVRAYSGTAAKCLDRAQMTPLIRWIHCRVEAGFEWADSLHRLLDRYGAQKTGEQYEAEGMVLYLKIPENSFSSFVEELEETGRGNIRLRRLAS